MNLSSKSPGSVNFYRLLFHLSALALILLVPVLLRPEADLARRMPPPTGFASRWLIVSIATIFLHFINVYVFIPKFLKPGKYFKYLLLVAGGFILMTVISYELIQRLPPMQMPVMRGGIQPPPVGGMWRITLIPMVISLALGISFEMILNWEVQRKEKAQIEREKLSSELSFLKSQVNPHFLFNSLNSIYALTQQQSNKAGDAILLLSNLMRYMLYGSNQGKIELAKELECVENFIALQKMRISSREDILIEFTTEVSDSKIMIEPLILMPFVENAFKHGVSYNQRSEVKIHVKSDSDYVQMNVFNTKKLTPSESRKSDSGIGLPNIKRRLDLLYPKKHTLTIKEGAEHFNVQLKIVCSDH